MSNFMFYEDEDGVIHKVQSNGGPAVTELSYNDDDGNLVIFNIPTVQNINFVQNRTVTSRNTIRGESRSQFGNISPATISFDIKLNENLFNNFKQLTFSSEGIVTELTVEQMLDYQSIEAAETLTLEDLVNGREDSFTIAQFIEALEDIKNNHRTFTLTTSSPLDVYLDNLALTNLSLTHDKESREVVNCSISAKVVKFTDIGWEIVKSTELADLTFVSEELEDTNNALVYDYVQTDGQVRFNDDWTTLVLHFGKYLSVEDRFGWTFKQYRQDKENKSWGIHENHADYIEATDVIPMDTAGETTIRFRAVSDYYGDYDPTLDSNGNKYTYNIDFPLVKIKTKVESSSVWKPQLNFAYGATDLDRVNDYREEGTNATAAAYCVQYEYGMSVSTPVTAYIDRGEVISEIRSGNKDWMNHRNPSPKTNSTNYQASKVNLGSDQYVWARDLADMFSVYGYMETDDGTTTNIVSRRISGDFEFFAAEINVRPVFDADFTVNGKEDRTTDVTAAWGFSEADTTVPVIVAGWILGTKMKIFLFSRDMFGNASKLVNTEGE